MDFREAFKELVLKIDSGYALARRVKNGETDTDDFDMARVEDRNYINGVIGAYMSLEKKVDELTEELKKCGAM